MSNLQTNNNLCKEDQDILDQLLAFEKTSSLKSLSEIFDIQFKPKKINNLIKSGLKIAVTKNSELFGKLLDLQGYEFDGMDLEENDETILILKGDYLAFGLESCSSKTNSAWVMQISVIGKAPQGFYYVLAALNEYHYMVQRLKLAQRKNTPYRLDYRPANNPGYFQLCRELKYDEELIQSLAQKSRLELFDFFDRF